MASSPEHGSGKQIQRRTAREQEFSNVPSSPVRRATQCRLEVAGSAIPCGADETRLGIEHIVNGRPVEADGKTLLLVEVIRVSDASTCGCGDTTTSPIAAASAGTSAATLPRF